MKPDGQGQDEASRAEGTERRDVRHRAVRDVAATSPCEATSPLACGESSTWTVHPSPNSTPRGALWSCDASFSGGGHSVSSTCATAGAEGARESSHARHPHRALSACGGPTGICDSETCCVRSCLRASGVFHRGLLAVYRSPGDRPSNHMRANSKKWRRTSPQARQICIQRSQASCLC